MNNDSKLLMSARILDREALAEIFDRYAHPLYLYVLRFCSSPKLADQIVGDVFAKVLDQCAVGRGPLSNLRSYLYEITYHLIIDEFRASSHHAPLELAELHVHDPSSIDRDTENRIEIEKALQAVQSLSTDQRHVIILRLLEGFSVAETATILGKTAGSVKVVQCRALKILREALASDSTSQTVFSSSGTEMAAM